MGSLETFDQRKILRYLSYVCLSIRINHDCIRTQRATNFKLCKLANISYRPVGIENELYWSTGSGTSHLNQTGIPGCWTHGKSDRTEFDI